MTEKKKFGKQTRYLIQDIYANSLSVTPRLGSAGNHARWSSDQTRERKRHKRTKVKEVFSTVVEEPLQTSSGSTFLPTTSCLAERSKTSSGYRNESVSNQSTLSMITTPWTTESSATTTTRSRCNEVFRLRAFSSSTSKNTSLEPRTTMTEGVSSSNGLSAFLSKESSQTFPDKERLEHVKFVHIEVPENQKSPLSSYSLTPSWTLEAFNSTELFSDRMKVRYPWSPKTDDQIDLSIDYPSTFTLVSQKCSWDTISGRYANDYTPMNHTPSSGDMHPNHDWTLVKKKGIMLGVL